MMDLDELQSVQSRERQKDSLQQLRESFYREAGEFIAQLRRERERAADQADDPWNAPPVNRLSDDIDTAENTVEAIYERRVGKIVKMASLAAADMPTEDEGLTAEERDLFETLVGSIERNRDRVDAILDGEDPASVAADEAAGDARPEPGATDAGAEPAPGPDAVAAPDRAETPKEAADATEQDPRESGGVDAADLMGGGTEPDSSTGGENDPVPPSDPATDRDADTGPTADPATDPTADPATDPTADPATGPTADPATDPTADPATGPTADPATDPTADATRETPGDSVPEPSTGSGPEPSTGSAPEPPAELETESAPSGKSEPDRSSGTGEADDDTQRIGTQPDTQQVERETVRITNDVGEIFGVDERRYDLTADDVVTLPTDNARPLLERDAAERLD